MCRHAIKIQSNHQESAKARFLKLCVCESHRIIWMIIDEDGCNLSFNMLQLQDYGLGLQNGKMGNFHSFEGDILLTAREEALLRAATMNDGPEERNSRPIIRGRSGMRHLWTRWPM